jgi:hypothetical protein
VKAELTYVGKITFPQGYDFCLDIKDPTGDEIRKGVVVNNTEEQDLDGAPFLM